MRRAGSILDVLSIAHDNSHPLNSVYLRLVGDGASVLSYRLLALASGVASIVLALCIGARRGTNGMLLAGGMVAISFPMVVYGSEARGYMPAVAAAFASFLLVERILAAPRWRWRVAFWLTASLGMLAHYVFLQVVAALGIWSAWHLLRTAAHRREALLEILRIYAVPLVVLAVLYVAVLRHIRIGGGPLLSLDLVLGQTIGWNLGLPASWLGVTTGALLVAMIAVTELSRMRRERDSAWIFYAMIVLVFPIVVVALRPPLLYPRYFLLNTAFLLLMLASLCARMVRQRRALAAVAGVALAIFCIGNATRVGWFLRDGRGDHRAALLWLASQSAKQRLTVTGSNDFALRNEIAFHGGDLPDGKVIVYQSIFRLFRQGADWLIVRREAHDPEPEPVVEDPHGNRYAQQRRFPSYGPSGADWYLFAR